MTIKKQVEKDIKELEKYTLAELYNYAKINKFDNRSAFPRFKKALAEFSIFYDQMKQENEKKKAEKLENTLNYEVVLIVDGAAKHDRFAVCDGEGNPVWHGRFFGDGGYNGEQSSSEIETAKKAIWLTSKIKEALNEDSIRLELNTDAEWLTWANATDGRGGKAKALSSLAKRHNIALEVVHIAGEENPADFYSRTKGFKKWQDNDLKTLATKIK